MAKVTKEKIKGCVKGSALTIATLCGVIGGIVLGITLKNMKGKTRICIIMIIGIVLFNL